MTPTALSLFDTGYDRDPHGTLAHMRHDGPVHRVSTPDGPPAWLLTRHAHVVELLGDPRMSADRRHSHGRDYTGFDLPPALDAHLLNTEGDQHSRLRGLIAPAFTAARVPELEPGVRAVADDVVSGLRPDRAGCVDLVADLAVPVPARVISDLVGLPEGAGSEFARWAHQLLCSDGDEPRARDTLGDMVRIVGTATAARPIRRTLLADLLAAGSQGRLDRDELTSMLFYLLFVWYEIMVNTIGAVALRALGETPRELLDDDRAADHTVDECLRFDPPYWLTAPRYARTELAIAGTTIGAGDTILGSLASANRDEAVFADPDRFDPARRANPHLSFARGPHSCPAAALTRLIMTATLRALLDVHPTAHLIESPQWRGNFRHRGPVALRVRVR
jgi:cytochrome P450